eukprot:1495019-Amphidinium_carterae.2
MSSAAQTSLCVPAKDSGTPMFSDLESNQNRCTPTQLQVRIQECKTGPSSSGYPIVPDLHEIHSMAWRSSDLPNLKAGPRCGSKLIKEIDIREPEIAN